VRSPKKEDEDAGIMENSWWTPDPRDLQIEEREKDYFLELLMGGSAPSEGAAERPAAVSSKTGQLAKKEATRGVKPAPSKGKRKGSERTPKGGSEPSARSEKKEASTWDEKGPEESQPSSQGQAVPPDLPGDPESKNRGL
jgi:hypothetical protein